MSEAEAEGTQPPKDEEKKSSDKAPPPKKTAPAKKVAKPDYSKGDVNLDELRMLIQDSDSVRRLQTALGTNVTGNFDTGTMKALKAWQNKMGFDGGRGRQVNPDQAARLFGDEYKIVQPGD